MPIHIGKIANGEASFQALFLKDAKNLGSQSMVGRVVIDTGAMATVINSQIANDLKLTAVDVREVYTADVSAGPVQCVVYSVGIAVNTLAGHTGAHLALIQDAAVLAMDLGCDCLLGMDLLADTTLFVNGPEQSFVLSF